MCAFLSLAVLIVDNSAALPITKELLSCLRMECVFFNYCLHLLTVITCFIFKMHRFCFNGGSEYTNLSFVYNITNTMWHVVAT